MSQIRPDPDVLLAQIKSEQQAARRGALKIFFGYAAGVGKTYTMLQTAHRAMAQGREVVVGYIEPHARPETQQLLAGMETLPVNELEYRGVTLKEFHLDAALQRHPDLLLVDELAHSNAAGSRHAKRWQDVEELLAAGIDVWTTLNVQHIESLNDVIGQITGVAVRETIPDHVFEMADDLELIDITPEELLERLQQGKIYLPEQAVRAIDSFFQKGNLVALRELSLRQAAQRIHNDVESARKEKSAAQPWATAERLLVCVGPSPTTARVIRTAKRMAAALDAPWLAVSVEVATIANHRESQDLLAHHFRLAERLGAETVTLTGQNVVTTILEFARSRNVTKIMVGKTLQSRWQRLLRGSLVDELLEHSGPIDVYVIHGADERLPTSPTPELARFSFWPYFYSVLAVGFTGLFAFGLRQLHLADAEANTVMLFLAAVAGVSYLTGRGPAILASVLSVLLFDFCFVPPHFSFTVSDAQYLVTFTVMLGIGFTIGTLTSHLRAQVHSTRLRERRTAALYELGKELSSLSGTIFLVGATARKISELLNAEVAVYLRRTPTVITELVYGQQSGIAEHPVSLPTAQWVIEHDQLAGSHTNTLPNAIALFLPIGGSQGVHGALAIRVDDQSRLLTPDTRRLLEACANQLALALERDASTLDAANSRIQAETEKMRSSLLSGVSHDLKTPLAAIAGASSSLLESDTLDDSTRKQLLQTVADEALRLNRLLENILQMSKLEAGTALPNVQWHVLEEIIGSALHRTKYALGTRQVGVTIPADFPLLQVDGLLLEQVFVNLLENAAHYTPEQTVIKVMAKIEHQRIMISVSDNGPGIPPGAEEQIFEKFYRANETADAGRGSGLGLAICRAIMQAHRGTIRAMNRASGGAEFLIQLPLPQNAPQVMIE